MRCRIISSKRTLPTLEQAFLRPRFAGFVEFQTQCSFLISDFLRENTVRLPHWNRWMNVFVRRRLSLRQHIKLSHANRAKIMKETWRWFGPQDPISLPQIRQAGSTGIVTALHHIYRGEAWPLDEVLKRKAEIESAGLVWSVVESIPVHNSIKLRSGPYRQYIAAWKDSLAAIAKAGVRVVCYNFMPLVDWTRTNLMWRLPNAGYALRFDAIDFAAYDLFLLERPGAEREYAPERVAAARARFAAMSPAQQDELERAIIAGLPGAESSYDRKAFRESLAEWEGITSDDLRSSLVAFLREVVPVAEELGLRLAIHPDDPPWPLFGLPRVVSTADDVRHIFSSADTLANGLTFCVGSFGARADNDLLAMIREFAPRFILRTCVRLHGKRTARFTKPSTSMAARTWSQRCARCW